MSKSKIIRVPREQVPQEILRILGDAPHSYSELLRDLKWSDRVVRACMDELRAGKRIYSERVGNKGACSYKLIWHVRQGRHDDFKEPTHLPAPQRLVMRDPLVAFLFGPAKEHA